VTDGTSLYWDSFSGTGVATILRGPIGGADAGTPIGAAINLSGLAVSGKYVLYTASAVDAGIVAAINLGADAGTDAATVISSTDRGPLDMNVTPDSTAALWVANQDGLIRAVPVPALAPTSTLVNNQLSPTLLILDGTYAYWIANNAIWRAPLAGGPPVSITPLQGAWSKHLAVDAVAIYIAEDPDTSNTAPGRILRLAKP
jgi:hypothetical protein